MGDFQFTGLCRQCILPICEERHRPLPPHIHDMATGGGVIKDSPTHFGQRTRIDGDAKAVPWTFSPLWCSP
ncbi:hypothetical protein AAC387_Pa02g3912 [Persea americana]